LTKFVQAYPKSSSISWRATCWAAPIWTMASRARRRSGSSRTIWATSRAPAPDSLLYLGVAMTRIKDTKRACGAFGELRDTYPDDVAGRLKGQYEAAIKG
jgi:hypothetical protein